MSRSALGWVATALLAWLAVGLVAATTGRLQPVLPPDAAYESITDEQADKITYEDLPGDDEVVSRLATPFSPADKAVVADGFATKLAAWPPGRIADPGQSVRNLLSVAAIADISEDIHEGEIARIVFDKLQTRHKHTELRRILAWVILHPGEGTVINQAPELGLRRHPPESVVRERSVLYAKKFLGRLLGKIAD